MYRCRCEAMKALDKPTTSENMPTQKPTDSSAKSTSKSGVLGPIQAKRFANQFPLLDNPANLPPPLIQSVLIAAVRGDIQQLDVLVKAIEAMGANIFDLTWNMDPMRGGVNWTNGNGPPVTRGNIFMLLRRAYATDATIYFARVARSKAPEVFKTMLTTCIMTWGTGINGPAESKRYWKIWEAIIVPQTEEQALSMFEDPIQDYLDSEVKSMWKQTAEIFLAQHCRHAVTSIIDPGSTSQEAPDSDPSNDLATSTQHRL